jgi:thimet oligopeptidase
MPFEEQGLRTRKLAQRYRKLVLAPGSSKPAAKLVEDFLGRPWSLEAYRNHMSTSD